MAAVELALTALEDLDALIITHSLPADTRARVARSLRGLAQFPRMGAALAGRWDGFRFVLGPWRWLVLVYVFIEAEDRVVIATIQDARSSSAATAVPSRARVEQGPYGVRFAGADAASLDADLVRELLERSRR